MKRERKLVKLSKPIMVGAVLIAMAMTASAQLIVNSTIAPVNQDIPYAGFGAVNADSQLVSGLSGTIESLSLTLNIDPQPGGGPYNGDFFATLTHVADGVTTVANLLNRVGRDAAGNFPLGYADPGMHVTLTDSAATDIHQYSAAGKTPTFDGNGLLTGTYQPDGRGPGLNGQGVDTSARNQMLGVFTGQSLNGQWILSITSYTSFHADMANFSSWSLTNVPEPQQYALLAGLGLIGFAAYRRFSLKAC